MNLVSHKERCPPNPLLRAFVLWWDLHGPFPIVIVSGDRTDEDQLTDYAKGRKKLADGSWIVVDQAAVVTNAQRAADSAHGHQAGIDCSPVRSFFANGNVQSIYLGNPKREGADVAAEGIRRLDEYDRIAKEHGLETGEKYPGICDRPHACDPNWRKLPLGPGVAA